MTIKKVWIEKGCVSTGRCAMICPDVFELQDQAVVKEDADFDVNRSGIEEAADSCPVEVIKYEDD